MPVIASALPGSLLMALRLPLERGMGSCFGAIRTSRIQTGPAARRRLLERGPAAVVFMTSSPELTAFVQKALADVLPENRGPVETDSVSLLDLDDPITPGTRNSKQVPRYLRQPQRPDRRALQLWTGVGQRVFQQRFPVFGRHRIAGTGFG
jgi:hypothetical protein